MLSTASFARWLILSGFSKGNDGFNGLGRWHTDAQNSSGFCKVCQANVRFPYMLSFRRYNDPALLKCHHTPPSPLVPCFVDSNIVCRKVLVFTIIIILVSVIDG